MHLGRRRIFPCTFGPNWSHLRESEKSYDKYNEVFDIYTKSRDKKKWEENLWYKEILHDERGRIDWKSPLRIVECGCYIRS